MSVASTAVTVATTATALHATDPDGSSVLVCNNSAVTVYVGGSDVTTSNGVLLAAGASMTVALGPSEQLYGIVATGTANVRVLRAGIG